MARTFNALALDRDVITFGEGGASWELGDIDEIRGVAFDKAYKDLSAYESAVVEPPAKGKKAKAGATED